MEKLYSTESNIIILKEFFKSCLADKEHYVKLEICFEGNEKSFWFCVFLHAFRGYVSSCLLNLNLPPRGPINTESFTNLASRISEIDSAVVNLVKDLNNPKQFLPDISSTLSSALEKFLQEQEIIIKRKYSQESFIFNYVILL